MQSRLSPLRLQLFWDLARSCKGLALQEKITVQEAALKSLQTAEMDINHSGISKLVKHWQKVGAITEILLKSGKSFPITEVGICFLPISLF
jgi:hypothetical protein